jgi:hypothetical protein
VIALLPTTSGVAQTAAVDPNRFEAEIRKFDEADKGTPFEPDGIVAARVVRAGRPSHDAAGRQDLASSARARAETGFSEVELFRAWRDAVIAD